MFTRKPPVVHRARRDGVGGAAAAAASGGGGVVTRRDIACGVVGCKLCASIVAAVQREHAQEQHEQQQQQQQHDGSGAEVKRGGVCVLPTLSAREVLIVPDANVVLHNMNALEDARVRNLVLLTTVLGEVQNRNKAIYARLQRVLADEGKPCYVFSNERHAQTHCVPMRGESANDYNDRCIRVAVQWYARHVADAFAGGRARADGAPRVALVTHDKALKARLLHGKDSDSDKDGSDSSAPSLPHNLTCSTLKELLTEMLGGDADLLEKVQYVMPDDMKESAQTRDVYDDHLDTAALEAGVRAGTLYKGKLRVSESSCFVGEIRGSFVLPSSNNNSNSNVGHAATSASFDRILLLGRRNVNRAVHDDTVVVRLLPVTQWRTRNNNKNNNNKQASNNNNDDAADDDTPADEAAALASGYAVTGCVVGIWQPNRRPYCGSIDAEDVARKRVGSSSSSSSSGSMSVLFLPKDGRVPRIRITTTHLDDLLNKRLCVVMDEWPVYSSYPLGHYVEVLGVAGDRDTEAAVILRENDIPHYDFSAGVYDCLPKGQWHVTAHELAHRLDLRDLCVVSVDPLGCRDIDDALHCRRVHGDHLEVGVHIADVTHFVREHTLLDAEAAKRSTSVYLVDRRINMLPQLLTENLCSLVAHEDRYAFSLLWEFDSDLNVVREWAGKTVIRSRAALYYGDAQRMIDDAADTSDVACALRQLLRLSRHFKAQRTRDGALFLASQEFKFKVDDAHLNPTDMQAYATFEANSMIEEWMLYANAAAARRVYARYPRCTLLRRHQRPAEGAFDTLNAALERRLHMRLDDTTSLTLNQSLDRCVDPHDAYFNTLIRILTTRCLRQAQYFSSGEVGRDEYYHFGLAMPIYTHFTSPIRRYADVIVHRQLAAVLGVRDDGEVGGTQADKTHSVAEYEDEGEADGHVPPYADAQHMEETARNINYRHTQAQRAGRDSQNLFTGFYLCSDARSAIDDEDGYVVRLTDTHVFVLVPRYGQESRLPRASLRVVPELLDKVRVRITIRRGGDAFHTRLVFALVGMMVDEDDTHGSGGGGGGDGDEAAAGARLRDEADGGVLVADDSDVDVSTTRATATAHNEADEATTRAEADDVMPLRKVARVEAGSAAADDDNAAPS